MKIKTYLSIGIFSSILLLNGCTPEEHAFGSGFVMGSVGTAIVASSYDYPRYRHRPYYYYHGRYYYGGRYHNGYYYHNGHRYHGGRYHRSRYRRGRAYR